MNVMDGEADNTWDDSGYVTNFQGTNPAFYYSD
jgi:hypothetical protein